MFTLNAGWKLHRIFTTFKFSRPEICSVPIVREVTKNPMTTLTELHSSLAEMENLPDREQSLQHFTNLGFMGEWPYGSHS